MEARLIDGLAQRYGQLPSKVLEEPAGLTLRMIALLAIGQEIEGEAVDDFDSMETQLGNISTAMR